MRSWAAILLGPLVAGYCAVCIAAAPQSAAAPEAPLEEVTVSANRVLDHKTLAHAIAGYVASHSTPTYRIDQIGRWHENVCPFVSGLQPSYNDFVARRILDVARGVGAPTRAPGKKCSVNVEMVFTSDPQALLTHIAKSYRLLLGFYPASQVTRMTTFSRPIQAWYETGTRSMDYQPPITGLNGAPPADLQIQASADPPLVQGAQVDSDQTAVGLAPSGVAGSYVEKGLRSEFLHVLIIADSHQVAHFSLSAIADYAAMLSLTRMAQLESCAPLASITDLLANGCSTPVAEALTAADRAYLKALYASDLEQNLNLERGEVHDRMMDEIEGR